ncbi:hypothetical protein OKW30_007816 [Paraburkholderia sp. Clong3]
MSQDEVIDRCTGFQRFPGNLGCIGVADIGIQRGDYTDRTLNACPELVDIRQNSTKASVGERLAAGSQVLNALEQAECDDGLEGVELELAGFGRHHDGQIVSDNFEHDLIRHFRHDRVDLARHDAGAGLHRRKLDFSQKAAARTRRKQAQTGTPVPELCREHGMSSASIYKWRSKYGGMDAALMTRMKGLETENARLRGCTQKSD